MLPAHLIRDAILRAELWLACHTVRLKDIPFLRALHRSVTADLCVLPHETGWGPGIRIDFRSPVFRIPVSVEKAQVGELDTTSRLLRPGAFRFFDWQTWGHFDGRIVWFGEQPENPKDGLPAVITGFEFRAEPIPQETGNLGVRLAEGVEGAVRIVCGGRIVRLDFQPVFWLLESSADGPQPVPIKTNTLTGLVVSLFDIGKGDPRTTPKATERLCRWVDHNIGAERPFRGTDRFLEYLRDWAPLGMKPLYPGLLTVLDRLEVQNLERHLFEFFADNWGIRGNRDGRTLAVKLLEARHTDPARIAIKAIYDLVQYRGIDPEELALIREAGDL